LFYFSQGIASISLNQHTKSQNQGDGWGKNKRNEALQTGKSSPILSRAWTLPCDLQGEYKFSQCFTGSLPIFSALCGLTRETVQIATLES